MYLRRTTSKLSDGTKANYLQLCENYRDKETGQSKTKVIYSFGREDKLDREKLKRLIGSIERYLKSTEED